LALAFTELGQDGGKGHANALNRARAPKQAIAACVNGLAVVALPKASCLGERAIQHWAEDLVPIVGALEPDTTGTNFVDRLVRAAVTAGARRPLILEAIGITDAELRNPVGRLPGSALIDLFTVLEREFADPAIALKMASSARPDCFSDLGYIATFAPTVGAMLTETVEIQSFRQNVWYAALDREASPARLTWRFPNSPEHLFVSAVEFSVGSYVRLYRNSIPAAPLPLAVQFRHMPRFGTETYTQLLGCPVKFGANETRIEFDSAQFELPCPNANPGLQRDLLSRYGKAMEWLSSGKKHAAFTYLYLASELNKSTLKLDRVAASFGLTERTLRRRLVEEGHPFRDLLERVRRDMCDLYRRENRRSITDIAELLGYSELSAFSRAHRQWYGKPPTE
jgi:AraC-like DNA-binding protein